MACIECVSGSASTPVGAETYHFTRDRYGRYTAEVVNLKHVAILVGLPAYREVPATLEPDEPQDEDEQGLLADNIGRLTDALAAAGTQIETLNSYIAQRDEAIARLTEERSRLSTDLTAAQAEIVKLTERLNGAAQSSQNVGAKDDAEPDPSTEPEPDDLRILAGLADAAAAKLASQGITTFEQIAALSPDDMARLDAQLDLRGRGLRNDWVGQAKQVLEDRAAPKSV